METATFGAGCFWGVEAAFREIPGVTDTAVGYMGGALEKPTYQDVCTDETGHAEVVHISFDPQEVSYRALVDKFFALHDPTTLNRQGPDFGKQYRSAIFFHSPEQQQIAQQAKADAQKNISRHIVTEITPAKTFWRAEEYHQKYLVKNRGGYTCHYVRKLGLGEKS